METKKNRILSSVLGLTVFAVACGSNPSKDLASQKSASTKSKHTLTYTHSRNTQKGQSRSSTTLGFQVVGPCKVSGDIGSFEITCTKEIVSFSVDGVSSDQKLVINTKPSGGKNDLVIEKFGEKLVGSEKYADRIEITIHFDDSSTGTVTLWIEEKFSQGNA